MHTGDSCRSSDKIKKKESNKIDVIPNSNVNLIT